MTVYVDTLQRYGAKRWCHVIADSLEELHEAAQRAGLKRVWFQDCPPAICPHYDAQPRIRGVLLKNGAVELHRFEFVNKTRAIRGLAPYSRKAGGPTIELVADVPKAEK